jgi:hypothetical protein
MAFRSYDVTPYIVLAVLEIQSKKTGHDVYKFLHSSVYQQPLLGRQLQHAMQSHCAKKEEHYRRTNKSKLSHRQLGVERNKKGSTADREFFLLAPTENFASHQNMFVHTGVDSYYRKHGNEVC